MPFNSLPFILFFSLFFLLYWCLFNKSLVLQNLLILGGSYFFYIWWDWRFLFLLMANSALNYFLAIRIHKTGNERWRSALLSVGLLEGLGTLFFFKYYNFFIGTLSGTVLNIILPLGISFYTFKTISYLLDVRRRKTGPSTDWVAFFCYVAFFPCLTAGPIDRAGTLMPQLSTKRVFNYDQTSDGLRQILWGLFKKVVIADNCAVFTAEIFNQYKTMPGSSLIFGALLFAVQMYADFSGYSDIAIGLGSMLGFNITRNFNYPFFAENIVNYWRRWHISLTSWLTDYVFTPLSISLRDYGKAGLIFAIIINFIAIGIWHGANWTYVMYGLLNGLFFIPAILRGTMNKKKKKGSGKPSFSMKVLCNRIGTFLLVSFLLVVFRADSLMQAFVYWRRIFSRSVFSRMVFAESIYTMVPLVFIVPMFSAEWIQRDKRHALEMDTIKLFPVRALIYLGLIGIILMFSATMSMDFIYFKF